MNRKALIFRISILLLFFVSLSNDTHAQKNKPKTNLEIFEGLVTEVITDLIYKPGINRENNFVFMISDEKNDKENISFFKNTIKKTLKENNIKINFSNNFSEITDSNANIFEIKIKGLKTRYNGFGKNKFLGEKTVKREIIVDADYLITTQSSFNKITENKISNFNDEVPYDDIEMLETPSYKFTKSEIPSMNSFENIFFPIILVAVSALTVILFFAIRTK